MRYYNDIMTLPLFFPTVQYVKTIDRAAAIPLEKLCEQAGEQCQAFGAWTQRPIVLCTLAAGEPPWVHAEPGDWGAVEVGVPERGSDMLRAQWALGALAFVLFDGVARATVLGKKWAQIERPRGREPRARLAMTNSERQKGFRERKRRAAE